MDWTKVCGTVRSGRWVLKGVARARMLHDNLDHLRVGWRSRGTYETAWVTPGHDCLCSYQHGRGAAVRPQTVDAIWDGVIGLWGRVAQFLSPWCGKKDVPTGVNQNRYASPRSCIRWHIDNESLFGPPNQPKHTVSMSLGHSVVFQVRPVPGDVPSCTTVTFWSWMFQRNRSMHIARCLGCRVLGFTLHTAEYTTRCVLSSCRRGGLCAPNVCARFVEPSSRGLGRGGK